MKKNYNYFFVFILVFFMSMSTMFAKPPLTNNQAGRLIKVGPNEDFLKPSSVIPFLMDGDTIEIQSGLYENDAAVWRANNLVIKGVGGFANIKSNGANAEGKGIWVIKGNNTKIENIEFSGAKVSDRNGAGIRQEGANLEISNCYFHDNENGILAGNNPNSNIIIRYSEFAYNGNGDGQTHNIYINEINSFTIQFSYVHHAKIGHNVKSRAAENYIEYNRIMDEKDGTSSYAIDLPSGGKSFIIGNLIQQGADTDNYNIISYGAEGLVHKNNDLYVVNNTIVNDRSSAVFLRVSTATKKAVMANNLIIGSGQISTGWVERITNLHIPKNNKLLSFFSESPEFVNKANYDYRIKSGSAAIDFGSILNPVHGYDLVPKWQYQHPRKKTLRKIKAKIDVGAYEFIE